MLRQGKFGSTQDDYIRWKDDKKKNKWPGPFFSSRIQCHILGCLLLPGFCRRSGSFAWQKKSNRQAWKKLREKWGPEGSL